MSVRRRVGPDAGRSAKVRSLASLCRPPSGPGAATRLSSALPPAGPPPQPIAEPAPAPSSPSPSPSPELAPVAPPPPTPQPAPEDELPAKKPKTEDETIADDSSSVKTPAATTPASEEVKPPCQSAKGSQPEADASGTQPSDSCSPQPPPATSPSLTAGAPKEEPVKKEAASSDQAPVDQACQKAIDELPSEPPVEDGSRESADDALMVSRLVSLLPGTSSTLPSGLRGLWSAPITSTTMACSAGARSLALVKARDRPLADPRSFSSDHRRLVVRDPSKTFGYRHRRKGAASRADADLQRCFAKPVRKYDDRGFKVQPLSTHLLQPDGSYESAASQKRRLESNIPQGLDHCECLGRGVAEDEAPYYTHLGAAPSVAGLRRLLEERLGLSGSALRLEKVVYTGKEGRTAEGCPLAKWVIRRSGLEEKVLCLARERPGHSCATAVLAVGIVVWEGVGRAAADELYGLVCPALDRAGLPTHRRCGLNQRRNCACQGMDSEQAGASFSFGCSWSMYFRSCKFARSRQPKLFRLREAEDEPLVEAKLQALADQVAGLYQRVAPASHRNQTLLSYRAPECRLGRSPGGPFTGVTACVDFCTHAHKDTHNMENGCTVVVSLTKHRTLEKPEDEQLHVLPLYVLADSDEWGSREGQAAKFANGSVEALASFPRLARLRSQPVLSCAERKRRAAQKAAETAQKTAEAAQKPQQPPPTPPQPFPTPPQSQPPPLPPPPRLQPIQLPPLQLPPSLPPTLQPHFAHPPGTHLPTPQAQPPPLLPSPTLPPTLPPPLTPKPGSVGATPGPPLDHGYSSSLPPLYSPLSHGFPGFQGPQISHQLSSSFYQPPPSMQPSQLFPSPFPSSGALPSFASFGSLPGLGQSTWAPQQQAFSLPPPPPLEPQQSLSQALRDPWEVKEEEGVAAEEAVERELMELGDPDAPEGFRTEWRENVEAFGDARVGGVGLALGHGSVLFEVAKRELHSTTALRQPDRADPKRVSLVFYHHKGLNLVEHGLHEMDRRKELKKRGQADGALKARAANAEKLCDPGLPANLLAPAPDPLLLTAPRRASLTRPSDALHVASPTLTCSLVQSKDRTQAKAAL